MADYPDDYSNPLPSMGPTQQGLGAGNFVNPPMQQQAPAADKRMEYLTRVSENPMYRMGSMLSGRDPIATQMHQQQQMIQQQQQFMTTKQLAVGGMLLQYIEKMSSIKSPELRNAVARTGQEFLGPLLKEIGFNASPSLFQGLLTQGGSSTQLSNLITSRFGNDVDKINELTSYLSQLDPKDVPATIKGLYDQDVDAALPKWLTHTSQLMSKIKSNPGLMTQLGGMSPEGKKQPLDPSQIMESILQQAKTPADRDAITKVFTDPKFTGFLANQGLMTGSTAEGIQKVTGEAIAKEETPGGMLEMQGKKADLALKTEELKAKPAQLALTQAQTQAALTPSVIPLAGVNTGIAVQGKGPGARPEIVLPPTQTPKDLTPAEKNIQSEELASADKLIALDKLYKPEYVGVVTGRIQGMKEPLGMVSGPESEFRAAVAALRNETLHKLSGAAVNPEEYKRIESELPTLNNAPSVFEARKKLTAKNLKLLMERRRQVLKSQGTDVDNLPPIPEDLLKPKTMPPAKRVQ